MIKDSQKDICVLGLDPGETTGVCVMKGHELLHTEQLDTKNYNNSAKSFNLLIKHWGINQIACEDYRVYAWESDKHKWANLHTPKLIGLILGVAWFNFVDVSLRMAIDAKQFVTDDKLEQWGLWQKGQRHARDAIRHAIYNQIFGSGAGKSR